VKPLFPITVGRDGFFVGRYDEKLRENKRCDTSRGARIGISNCSILGTCQGNAWFSGTE